MSLYLAHFGLGEPPFRITPHTDYFFAGAHRGSTLDALIYAITQDEGIVKVSGEVGSGKTMLCRMLLEKLPPAVETIYLANPSLSRQEIIGAIADELGITADGRSTHSLTRAIQDALVERYAEGRRVVLLIDEAHAMPSESLEEVRLLSNLESKSSKLLQIALFAQPELDQRLAAADMRQLRERITQHFDLAPLPAKEVAAYLEFRLRTAGYRGPMPFTASAVEAIARASQGLSRRINILADKALLAAYSTNSHQVDHREVSTAIRDARFQPLEGRGWSGGQGLLVPGLLAAVLVALAFALLRPTASPPPVAPAAESAPSPAPTPLTQAAPAAAASPSPAAPTAAPDPEPTASPRATSAPFGPLTRRSLERFDAWLANARPRHYFIQLYAADTTSASEIESFLRRHASAIDSEQVRTYRSDRSGRDRLGIVFGEFDSREAASAAIGALPEALRRLDPYPRQVSRLQ